MEKIIIGGVSIPSLIQNCIDLSNNFINIKDKIHEEYTKLENCSGEEVSQNVTNIKTIIFKDIEKDYLRAMITFGEYVRDSDKFTKEELDNLELLNKNYIEKLSQLDQYLEDPITIEFEKIDDISFSKLAGLYQYICDVLHSINDRSVIHTNISESSADVNLLCRIMRDNDTYIADKWNNTKEEIGLVVIDAGEHINIICEKLNALTNNYNLYFGLANTYMTYYNKIMETQVTI